MTSSLIQSISVAQKACSTVKQAGKKGFRCRI